VRNLALVGGVDSLSQIQLGLGMSLSNWVRQFQGARSLGQKLSHAIDLRLRDVRLYIPAVSNRTTGMSMGEHTEITAKEWQIGRQEQDEIALQSHRTAVAAWDRGFFDDLVIELAGTKRDTIPRKDTSLEKLARLPPSFDRTSGKGSLTAGNSSPLTDGAAAIWVGSSKGVARLPSTTPRVKLVDWEIASVDFRVEGLLMAPAFAIPRLLARHDLRYDDIHLWEIHEAFAAQVAFHLKALQDRKFLAERAHVPRDFGPFPRERMNPNGGSTALGHPFGATGARIISMAVKELAAMAKGNRAIVSICADGGLGSVLLLEAA
jgi:acetyl-CoA C-acetyltransferase